jgi:hypothetical protein
MEAQKLHRKATRCVGGDQDDRPQPGGMEANILNREAGQPATMLLIHT